ncbi:MAG: hypothetical protein ABIA74_00015 [bacterium]
MKLYQNQTALFNFLIVLFIFSFLVRAIVFHFFLSKNENFWQVDSVTYHQVAVGINNGYGIAHAKDTPTFYRLPGYPLFLSFFYKILGPVKTVVLWVQIFLAALIPILIFYLSLSLFPANLLLAKVSSIYTAIHLGFVLYSGFFMSESLFIFLFLLFTIFFFKKKPLFFISGIFLGCASLVRPVGQYFIILSIILILMFSGFGFKKFRSSLLLFLGWLIPVSFWLIRNFILLGHLFFHTLPGGHFLYLSAARVAMHEKNCDYWQVRQYLKEESDELIKLKELELSRSLNEIEHCNVLEGLALKYFKKYPIRAVKNWLTDIMRTTLSLYSSELIYLDNNRKEIDYFNKNRTIWDMFRRYLFPETTNGLIKIILFLEIIFSFFILLGFVLGIFKILFMIFMYVFGLQKLTQLQLNNIRIWLKVVPFIVLFIVLALSGGYARMRLPAEPFLIILSFSFWMGCFEKMFKKN